MAQQYATPRNGEGISTFLERFNRPGRAYYNEFLRLNQKRLRGKKELLLGVRYMLPPLREGRGEKADSRQGKDAGTTLYEPLFGKELSQVKITGSRLKGACFYVVSGHGGPDPGAVGRVGKRELHEDEYAYDVALRLARNLMQEGAEVHIIIQDAKDGIRDQRFLDNSKRETCMGDAIPFNQVARLEQRAAKINALSRKDKEKYKRAIFIHVDSRGKKDQVDVFFYHCPGSKNGQRLAENIHRTFERKYDKHQPNRGFRGTVSERKLYVLANSNPPAAFLELGNLQNARDRKRLVLASNRQALADWICEGVVKDFKNN